MSLSIPKTGEALCRSVEAFCLRQGLLPCRRLLIALSGGADSVTLLHVMKELGQEFGYELSAMHVNHMIRGAEANRDEAFCRSLCENMGVDFHSVSIDIPALAVTEQKGIEETARHYRYKALNEYASAISADRIATAHTATDQVETVLMQLVRGTAVAGGIRPRRGILIRPLLEVTREQILAYTAENRLSYVEDSTNADDRYTRNHLRHTVLPVLKSINPNVEAAFGRFAALRTSENDFLNEEAERQLNISHTDGKILPVMCNLAELQALPKVLRVRAIAAMASEGGVSGLNHAHFEAIDELIEKGKPGASLSLPDGYVVTLENGKFCLSARFDEPTVQSLPQGIAPFELKMGENLLPDGSILFAYREMNENTEKYIKEKQIIYKLFINTALDFGKISNAVWVRSRIAGDRILCRGMHRNVKKNFCDRHIPIEHRPYQPILYDSNGILWIPTLNMQRDGVSAEHNDTDCLRLIYMGDKRA